MIRCVSGLTKSKRLKYRMSERERIANLNGVSSIVVPRAQPLHTDTVTYILNKYILVLYFNKYLIILLELC